MELRIDVEALAKRHWYVWCRRNDARRREWDELPAAKRDRLYALAAMWLANMRSVAQEHTEAS
jgi:hypothetical protein